MRVIVFVKATDDSEAMVMPSTELMEAMGRYNEELVAAGMMKDGDGLKPTSEAVRVYFNGADRTVSKGPFTPVSEQVAGYWIWQVKDMDEAIAWVKRCPNPMLGPSFIDIRPYFELEDFGDAMTPELAAQEDALRRKMETP